MNLTSPSLLEDHLKLGVPYSPFFLGFVIVDLVSFFSAGDLIKVCEKLNSPRCCFFNSFTQHFDGGMRDLIINYEGVIYKNISPLSKNELTKKMNELMNLLNEKLE